MPYENPYFDEEQPGAAWDQGGGSVMASLLAMAMQKRKEAEEKRRFDMDFGLREQKQGWEAPGVATEAEMGAYTRAGVRPEVAATKQYPPQPKDPTEADQKQSMVEYYIGKGFTPKDAAEMVEGRGTKYGDRAGYYMGQQSKDPVWDSIVSQIDPNDPEGISKAVTLYQQAKSKVNPNQPVNEAKASYSQAFIRINSRMEDLEKRYREAQDIPNETKRNAAMLQIESEHKKLDQLLQQLQALQKDTTMANKPINPSLQKRLDDLGWGDWVGQAGGVPNLGEDAPVDTSIPGPNGGRMVSGRGPDGKLVYMEIDIPTKK